MSGLRTWTPDPAQPQLHEWWLPLIAFSRRVRIDGGVWPVHVDEFQLLGGVERGKRPALFLYRHDRSGGEVVVDGEGQPYRWIPAASGTSAGRYVSESSLTRAVWTAGLPHAVTPWPEDQRPPSPFDDPNWAPPHERSVRRRRPQLTLLQGGDEDAEDAPSPS